MAEKAGLNSGYDRVFFQEYYNGRSCDTKLIETEEKND